MNEYFFPYNSLNRSTKLNHCLAFPFPWLSHVHFTHEACDFFFLIVSVSAISLCLIPKHEHDDRFLLLFYTLEQIE